MSIKLINAVMKGFAGRTNEKLLLLVLADFANDQGLCFPSEETMAERTGVKRRQVASIKARLLKSGWLKVERRGSGPGNSSRYRVVVPDKYDVHCIFNGRSNMPPITHLRGRGNVQSATTNVQFPVANMQPIASDPSVEPSEGSPNGKRSRRKPEIPLPENFTPKPRHEAYAAKHGLSLEVEHEKFRSHHLAHDGRRADWDHAFDNWLIKTREFSENGRKPGSLASAPAVLVSSLPDADTVLRAKGLL